MDSCPLVWRSQWTPVQLVGDGQMSSAEGGRRTGVLSEGLLSLG